MKPRALGGHTAAFETKGVAGNTPSISATEERNAATAGPRAALVDALEASFPDAEIRVLQGMADGFAMRMNGPDLNLADLTDDEEDAVMLMSSAAWDALQQIALAEGGVGISAVVLGPEFSGGGQELVDRLKQLGVEYLDVSVPAEGHTIDFRDRHGEGPQGDGFRHLTLNIRPGEPGSTLEHIYVPDGTTVKGSWEGDTNVLLHFTDAQGAVLRTTRLFQSEGNEWLQLPAIDLDCIEQGNDSRQAFIDAVRRVIPEAVGAVVSDMYARLQRRVQGKVLDLSTCVGEEARAVRELPPEAWKAFFSDPLAAGVTTLIVSHELALGGLLPTGLHQQRNPQDPRTAFVAAAQAVLPDVPLGELFDKLLRRTRQTVLDLSDFSGNLAKVVRFLPQSAWIEFLRHPQAADLASIVVDSELFAGGPLAHGLTLHLHSADRRQSPDPRTAFVAYAQDVPLGQPPGLLFDVLLESTRGKVLHLRSFEDVQALRRLPPEAWKAFLRHHRAALLTTINVSPELYLGGPLVPGLKMRLNLRDPRAAFVAAAEQALPGRPVHKLFDVLVGRIRADKLDLSDAVNAVNELRSLPQSAWNAFMRHADAADLRSIIASETLFAGGPLVDTLQIERAAN